MIPKTLLSCWFGRGQKNDLFKMCEESKRRVLPDWNRFEVNEDTIDPALLATKYMQEVQRRGEFVKMTELGRLWALWKFGGVYCDEDVEILKPFDPLLNTEFFIGREDANYVNGAVVASVAKGEIITHLLDKFPSGTDGAMRANRYGPIYLTEQLKDVACTVHPVEFFYPFTFGQTMADAVITPNTYAAHHWAYSWKGQ